MSDRTKEVSQFADRTYAHTLPLKVPMNIRSMDHEVPTFQGPLFGF